MSIRILVNGAAGKMGQACVKAIQADAECELVGQTGRSDNLAEKIKIYDAQVVIDFTTPETVYENTLTIIDSGAHPVIGTTGLTPDQIDTIKQRCAGKNLGGIVAPNFSVGAVLMMQFSKLAAEFYPDVEIIELHHPAKKDAPSGTALKTAEEIAKIRKIDKITMTSSQEVLRGARGAQSQGIPIHSVRLPGLVAGQQVLFGGVGETLTIHHNTIDRAAFMPGVLFACKKVKALNHLVYGLEYLLF